MDNNKWIHDASWRDNNSYEMGSHGCIKHDWDSLDEKIMKELLYLIKLRDWSTEDLADVLSVADLLSILELHLYALNKGEYQLAQRIGAANGIIKERKIKTFIDAVANNTQDEFLNSMPLEDKVALKLEMGIFKYGNRSVLKLTEEEQKYLDIIDKSIMQDIEQIARTHGFNSADEWTQDNPDVSKYMQLIM